MPNYSVIFFAHSGTIHTSEIGRHETDEKAMTYAKERYEPVAKGFLRIVICKNKDLRETIRSCRSSDDRPS